VPQNPKEARRASTEVWWCIIEKAYMEGASVAALLSENCFSQTQSNTLRLSMSKMNENFLM